MNIARKSTENSERSQQRLMALVAFYARDTLNGPAFNVRMIEKLERQFRVLVLSRG